MAASKLRLYHYWRSSSSWRVRWALAHHELACEMVSVNLLDDETDRPEHRARNPAGFVPVLELVDQTGPLRYLAESVAILEWLEDTSTGNPLLPSDPLQRAHVRQLCEIINSGTQPIQNLNVMHFHSAEPAEQKRWSQHWIRSGLTAFEKIAAPLAGRHCLGDTLTAADLFLIPQCYNALRFDVKLEEFPLLARLYEAGLATAGCQSAHPDRYAP
jgi:maleylacetoacetate isomerase